MDTIRPVDLPLLRLDLIDYCAREGPGMYTRHVEDAQGRESLLGGRIPSTGPPSVVGNELAASELRRLRLADLYCVSQEMTELAVAAARTLPGYQLRPSDLPSEHGLILYDHAIDTVKYAGISPRIVAASWGLWHQDQVHPGIERSVARELYKDGGVWITWWADRDSIVQQLPDAERARAIQAKAPRVVMVDESLLPFRGDPELAEHTPGLEGMVGAVLATWLLMQQTVVQVATAQYDRATRKRISRRGIEPPAIRVITLRSPISPGAGEGQRSYHHRWVVRGHWRQQWYRSESRHKPVWIAPHIKGPGGAPMLGGEKVYAWRR